MRNMAKSGTHTTPQLKQTRYSKGILTVRGAKVTVKNPANLVAITINPVLASGISYPKEEFLRNMAMAVSVPVYNVCI